MVDIKAKRHLIKGGETRLIFRGTCRTICHTHVYEIWLLDFTQGMVQRLKEGGGEVLPAGC